MKAKKIFMAFLAIGLLFTSYSCKGEDEPTVELKNQVMFNGEKIDIGEGDAYFMGEGAEFMFHLPEQGYGMLHVSGDFISGKKVDITTTIKSDDNNRQFFNFTFGEDVYFNHYELNGYTGWFKIEKKSEEIYNVSFDFKGPKHTVVGNFDAKVYRHE